MTEAAEALESKASPEQQKAAAEMGWVAPDKFRGAPEKWIDADVFLERGEQIMPILRSTNKRLTGEISTLSRTVKELTDKLDASADSMTALKEFHSEEVKRRLAETKRELTADLKKAREDGNVDREVEIVGELSQLKPVEEAHKDDDKVALPRKAPPASDPEYDAWKRDNPWFGVDHRKTALAIGIGNEIRSKEREEGVPDGEGIKGRAFLEKVQIELDQMFKPAGGGNGKVEGARGGGGGSQRGKRFADLPADAQNACHGFAGRLVGEGRAYKTMADWESAYVKDYYEGEEA